MTAPGAIDVRCEAALATITLASPDRHNALSVSMWRAITEAVQTLSLRPELRCLVVTGAGTDFSAGADISEFAYERDTAAHVRRYHEEIIAPALRAVAKSPLVTIAKVRGYCIGGGLELACHCDLRIGSDTAKFGAPVARLGFPMAPGEMLGLLELVGRATVLELLLEGAIWDADIALRRGLVSRVVADDALDGEVEATIGRVMQGAPFAAQTNKWVSRRLVQDARPLSAEELERAFAYAPSEDHREGVSAFLAHRTPKFQGR